MQSADLFFEAVYMACPMPCLLLRPNNPHFTIYTANVAYLEVAGKTLEEIQGKNIFEVFPNNPKDKDENGVESLRDSFVNLLATGLAQKLHNQKYDVLYKGVKNYTLRYWDAQNIPIKDEEGKIVAILHTVWDKTDKVLMRKKQEIIEKEEFGESSIFNQVESPSEWGSWELDIETGVMAWSDGFYKICGLDKNKTAPSFQNTIEIIHPDDRERAFATLNQVIEKGGMLQVEKRLVRPNGTFVNVQSILKAIENKDKKVVGVIGVFLNQTSRKTMEGLYRKTIHRIRERNVFIETIIKNLPIGLAVTKINEEKPLLSNPLFSEIYGWPSEEVLDNIAFAEKVYPDEQQRKSFLEKVARDMESRDMGRMRWENIEITTQKGEKRVVNGKKIPIYDQGLIISTVMDVTNEARLANETRLIKDKLEKIMETSLDIICTVDKQGCFQTVSNASLKILGYAPAELKQTHFLDLIDEKDISNTTKQIQATYEGIETTVLENKCRRKNGSLVTMEWSVKWEVDCALLFLVGRDITEKKQAQLEMGLLIDNSEDAFILVDKQLNIVTYNKKFATDYAYLFGKEIYKGINILDYSQPERKRILPKIYENVFKGFMEKSEISLMAPNGEEKTYYLKYKPAYDETGNIIGAFVSSTDISEKERAMRLLKESNQRFEYVTKATSDAIWDWDIVKNEILWAENFKKIFKHPDMGSLTPKKSWLDLIHPDEKQTIWKKLMETIEGETNSWEQQYRLRKGNGSYAHIVDRGFVIRDANNKAIRMVGSKRDITQRKNEILRLLLLESTIEQTKDGVLITEAFPIEGEGPKIMYANKGLLKMTGYEAHELIGKTPRILQGYRSDREALEKLKESLIKGINCEIETINYKKDGQEYWVNISVSPVSNHDGEITHFVAIQKDITKNKTEEYQKHLLSDITHVFVQNLPLPILLQQVLDKLVDYGGFSFAEAWLIAKDKKQLNFIANSTPSESIVQFYIDTAHIKSFKKGESLPGMAWERQQIIAWENVGTLEGFVRKQFAIKAGIEKSYAVPINSLDEEIGVLVLGFGKKIKTTIDFTYLFENIGRYIGSEIKDKQSKQELQKVFNLVPDIVCIAGMDGYFKKTNPAATKLLGYSEQELLTKAFVEFIHPDDRDRTKLEMKRQIKGIPTNYFENRFLTKAGYTKWLVWAATAPFEDGEVYAVAKDITEKKDLESRLQRSNELAMIGSWEFDLISRKVYWSGITRKIHEVDEDFEPTIENAMSFYKSAEIGGLIPQISREAMEKGKSWDLEAQIITAKGVEKWVRVMGDAEIVNGKCIRYFGNMQDIDERKKGAIEKELLIKELMENNKELKQFSYITTHNLRAPLTNLMAISKMIDTQSIADPVTVTLIESFKKSTIQLNETLNDLLNILIIKDNKNLELIEISFGGTLQKVQNTMKAIIENSLTSIEADFKVENIKFSHVYLESILLNLMTNSIKYAQPNTNPIIKIKTFKGDDNRTKLVFSDNGIGMDMEKVKTKIFGFYQRFHKNTNSKGIGLYLIHSQITAMGGKIEVDSKVGEGTTFTITF